MHVSWNFHIKPGNPDAEQRKAQKYNQRIAGQDWFLST
jgi:hypothetical protein